NRCGMEPLLAPTALAPASSPLRTGFSTGPTGSTSAALSGRTGSAGSRRGTAGSRGRSRQTPRLGMGALPELPAIAPEKVVMADPVVPDHKRFCPTPDCHDGAGNPTALTRRQAGHCPQCGRKYSFLSTLRPADVVADQYEVKGCLAYGGL